MPTTMRVTASHRGDLRFQARGESSGKELTIDAAPEHGGSGEGFRPMELLLAGLAGCTAIDVLSILRKMREEVSGYEIHVSGERQDEHPTKFTRITVEHVFRGNGLSRRNVERAVSLSAEKYCAASASLAAGAKIENVVTILEDGPPLQC